MSFWFKLRILKMFLQLVRDPNRTDLIFQGVKLVSKNPQLEPLKHVEGTVLSQEGFRAMYEEGYMPKAPLLEDLAKLPADSFGRALYKHMSENGLGFEIFPQVEIERPVHYLSARIYQDHDLWHVLLGRGIEVEDELAIQAFGIAQFQSPVGTMIVAGGILHLLGKNPVRAVKAIGEISEGYALGKKARFLLSIRLHELFAKPLHEVRQICGLSLFSQERELAAPL